MPQFNYRVKNQQGQTVRGTKFAETRKDLISQLRANNLMVLSIEEMEKPVKAAKVFLSGPKVKLFELSMFFRQLATMLRGGLPLIRALESLIEETRNKTMKNCIANMITEIRDGKSLSDAVRLFPNVFSSLSVSIIESGEKIGALDTMLDRLSDYIAANDRLNRKLISSLSYPIFLVGFFIVALGGITIFLIPSFKSIYSDMGANLPALTATVFHISDVVVGNLPAIAGGSAIAIFMVYYIFFVTPQGKYLRDRLLITVPVFGPIVQKATIAKFCKTVSTLLSEGIAVTDGFQLAAKTAGNLIVEEGVLKAGKLIMEGEIIPQAIKKTKVFPPLVIQMASVGVESGRLPEMLDKVAGFYEEQIDAFTSIVVSMIEPILIIFLGLTFALVAVALYLPLFKIGTIVSGGA